MEVYSVEVYDSKGALMRLDFFSRNDSSFQFEAVWDDRDEQTPENRLEFRKWADNMAKNLGFKIAE